MKKTLIFLILCSCKLDPPDVKACVSLSSEKGFCTYTISDKEEKISGKPWEALKSKSLVVPAESWSEIKKFILKVCEKTEECSVSSAQEKFNDFDSHAWWSDQR